MMWKFSGAMSLRMTRKQVRNRVLNIKRIGRPMSWIHIIFISLHLFHGIYYSLLSKLTIPGLGEMKMTSLSPDKSGCRYLCLKQGISLSQCFTQVSMGDRITPLSFKVIIGKQKIWSLWSCNNPKGTHGPAAGLSAVLRKQLRKLAVYLGV